MEGSVYPRNVGVPGILGLGGFQAAVFHPQCGTLHTYSMDPSWSNNSASFVSTLTGVAAVCSGEALCKFGGAVVIVSHDEKLLRAVRTCTPPIDLFENSFCQAILWGIFQAMPHK